VTVLVGVVLLALAGVPSLVLAGLLHADAQHSAVLREISRLTAPLAPAREQLTEDEVFVRRTPGVPLPELIADVYHGRHRYGDKGVIGSAAQQAGLRALTEPTFDSLVRANWDTGEREALSWRCDVCRGVVADGEKPHDNCHGCGCPCTLLIGQPGMVMA
jgi:hypothetical protein